MLRRSVLAGAGAALLNGCGVRGVAVRAAGRLHGCVDVPVPPAAGTRIVRGAVRARHVAGPVRYAIVLPQEARGIDAVAYVLPGRGGDAESELGLGIAGFFAGYLRGGGKPFALAVLDAGESYFHARAGGEDRGALLARELPDAVRAVLAVPRLREALIGQSMGGYGALLAAEREPRRFRAVAVAGPAIFPSYADEARSVGDAFDGPADYARNDVVAHAGALRGRPVRIRSGARDPFVTGVRLFARACPSADVRIEAGCHDDGFWRASAASLIEFVGTHL